MKTEKQKIGIDIDDVIFDTFGNFVKFYDQKGFEVNEKENGSYFFYEEIGITKEKLGEFFREFSKGPLAKNLDLNDFVKEVLEELSSNYELILITSRPNEIVELTFSIIDSKFGDGFFKDLVFSGEHNNSKSKAEICKELGIKILIEDRKKYAIDCVNSGINVLLMDKPWNQDFRHEKLVRVKNWKEVLGEIKKIEDIFDSKNNINGN